MGNIRKAGRQSQLYRQAHNEATKEVAISKAQALHDGYTRSWKHWTENERYRIVRCATNRPNILHRIRGQRKCMGKNNDRKSKNGG